MIAIAWQALDKHLTRAVYWVKPQHPSTIGDEQMVVVTEQVVERSLKVRSHNADVPVARESQNPCRRYRVSVAVPGLADEDPSVAVELDTCWIGQSIKNELHGEALKNFNAASGARLGAGSNPDAHAGESCDERLTEMCDHRKTSMYGRIAPVVKSLSEPNASL